MATQPESVKESVLAEYRSGRSETISALARTYGLPRETVRNWVRELKRASGPSGIPDGLHGPAPSAPLPPSPDARSYREDGDAATVEFGSPVRLRTLDEVLRHAEVDPEVWRVKSWECTSWEVGMKLREFDPRGKVASETPRCLPLWRVKVRLERIQPKPFQDATKAIFDRLATHAPKYEPIRRAAPSDPHLLEIDLFDVHFGKLAWGPETGGHVYDLRIAERLYKRAVEDLLNRAAGYEIERILLPVGNDFYHVDGITGATTNGTPQDVDGRYAKLIEIGEMAVIEAVARCRQIAPVRVLHVPGNHDRTASFHLCRTLWAWYRQAPDVSVDTSPMPRKYEEYGVSLIGFTHGNEERPASLPTIMATEVPQAWAATRCREFHLGHWHQAKKTEHAAVNTHDGVVVRTLRSLSASDAWHARKGYQSTNRAAEAFLFSRAEGFAANFVAYARD